MWTTASTMSGGLHRLVIAIIAFREPEHLDEEPRADAVEEVAHHGPHGLRSPAIGVGPIGKSGSSPAVSAAARLCTRSSRSAVARCSRFSVSVWSGLSRKT